MQAKNNTSRYTTVRIFGYTIRIPKKGRIRIVFAVILLFFLFRFLGGVVYTHLHKTKSYTPQQKHSIFGKKKSDSSKKLPSGLFSRTLSRSDLITFLSQNPPNLSRTIDTARQNNRDVLLHYTLDSSLQELGAELFKQYHPKYGALAAIDPVTGKILSLVSYTNPEEPPLGNDLYCRAIFPAASVFKTITAAAAIEMAHLSSESTLKLVGNRYTLYRFQLVPQLNGGNDVTLRKAYAESVNPIFARIGMYTLGYSTLASYAKRFGFTNSIPFELPVDTARLKMCDSAYTVGEFACGFNRETTISPIMGALIASAISENGKIPLPILVDSIVDRQTTTSIYKSVSSTWQTPITPQTSQQMRDLMSEVVQSGTARKAFRLVKNSYRFNDFVYGGKTGSVDLEALGKIDWFIGFAKHPSDKRQRIALGVVTVHGAFWTVHSSYIAAELMNRYIRNIQINDEVKKAIALTHTQPQQK